MEAEIAFQCKELLSIPSTWQDILRSVEIKPDTTLVVLVFDQLNKRIQGTCLDPPAKIIQCKHKLYIDHAYEMIYPLGSDVCVCLAQNGKNNEYGIEWKCFISRDKKRVFL